MTRKEILEFVGRNTTSFMATVENGEPRVRAMETPVIDENGLTFCTGTIKRVCKQLSADPAIELCYFSPESGTQIRLRGRVEFLDDLDLKKRIVEERFTFLKPVVESYGWGALSVFRLSGGKAFVWTASNPAGASEAFDF